MKQKITSFLWFNGEAEEAAKFYVSIFKNSKITSLSRNPEEAGRATGRPKGSVMTVGFRLDGQDFVAMNGGPGVKFNEAISLMVSCRTQAELDRFWKKLAAGGKAVQCGWLKDRYGVSWQIVPEGLFKLLDARNPAATGRVMNAVMQMTKLDMKKLKAAYNAKTKAG